MLLWSGIKDKLFSLRPFDVVKMWRFLLLEFLFLTKLPIVCQLQLLFPLENTSTCKNENLKQITEWVSVTAEFKSNHRVPWGALYQLKLFWENYEITKIKNKRRKLSHYICILYNTTKVIITLKSFEIWLLQT